jgi:hypothetical protein
LIAKLAPRLSPEQLAAADARARQSTLDELVDAPGA